MPNRPFSSLPGDIHDSLRASWTDDRPADALLGAGDSSSDNKASGIHDLQDQAYEASSASLANHLKERNEAARCLVDDLVTVVESEEDEPEPAKTVIEKLLDKHFEQAWLPLNNGALQAVVEELFLPAMHRRRSGNKILTFFSPLLTMWSSRVRAASGVANPELELTWPEQQRWSGIEDLGTDMRDVNLTVKGKVKGNIGTGAQNCQFRFDEIEGEALKGAQDCTATASTVKGPVLSGAYSCVFEATAIEGKILESAAASTVTSESIKAPNALALGNGCTVSAQTVHCSRIWPDRLAEEGHPCTVKIDKLHGSIEEGEGWTVKVGETIAPTLARIMPSERLITENSYDTDKMYYKDYPKHFPEKHQYIIPKEDISKLLGEKALNMSPEYIDQQTLNIPLPELPDSSISPFNPTDVDFDDTMISFGPSESFDQFPYKNKKRSFDELLKKKRPLDE